MMPGTQCIQLMSSPWMSESMDKVLLLEPTPHSVEILASSYKSMRILTFQMDKPKAHKQHMRQILFMPYPTLKSYGFQGMRPSTEFKWSLFLPVQVTKFQPMAPERKSIGKLSETVTFLHRDAGGKPILSAFGKCLHRILSHVRSWGKQHAEDGKVKHGKHMGTW